MPGRTIHLTASFAHRCSIVVAVGTLVLASGVLWRAHHPTLVLRLGPRIRATVTQIEPGRLDADPLFAGHPWADAAPQHCQSVDDSDEHCSIGPFEFIHRTMYDHSASFSSYRELWEPASNWGFQCDAASVGYGGGGGYETLGRLRVRSSINAGVYAFGCFRGRNEGEVSQSDRVVRVVLARRWVRVGIAAVTLHFAHTVVGLSLGLFTALAVWRRRHPPHPGAIELARPWREGVLAADGTLHLPGVVVPGLRVDGSPPGPVLVVIAAHADRAGPYRPHAADVVSMRPGTLNALHLAVTEAARHHALITILGVLVASLPVFVVALWMFGS